MAADNEPLLELIEARANSDSLSGCLISPHRPDGGKTRRQVAGASPFEDMRVSQSRLALEAGGGK